ncbi:cation transporter [Candidatus Woesearchaeota archaeon]|nr:cation transporter [Candidatus Woesearchaeota archaeon]
MYIIKVFLKLFLGTKIGSISLYTDGLHNLSDVFQALLVVFALYLSRQPENAKYPIGKSSVESIGTLLIGLTLFYAGLIFLAKSLLGLLNYFNIFPFLIQLLLHVAELPSQVDLGNSFWITVIVVGFSIVCSWIVSRYQINVGRMHNHPSLISDGKETLSDSFVELAVLSGIIGTSLGLYYLDYLFGMIVAILVLRTATELIKESSNNLLQRSLGQEEIVKIEKLLSNTSGIEGFDTKGSDRVMAYKIGKFSFVFAKVYVSPLLTSEGFYHIKKGIHARIRELMSDSEARIYLKQSVLDETPRRALIPVSKTLKDDVYAFIEEDFFKAKQYYIVDLKGDRIVSVICWRNTFKDKKEINDFLKKKRIDMVYLVKETKETNKFLAGVKVQKTNFLCFKDLFH